MPAVSNDAKQDIAFVRREKKDDDTIIKKLEEVYGKVTAARDNGYRRNKKGWECPSCGYVNFESRLACGECLDVHPEVSQGTKFQRGKGSNNSNKNGSNNSDTSSNYTAATGGTSSSLANASSDVLTSTTEQFLNRLPNIKQPGQSFDNFTKILQISDRCYRVADFPSTAVALGRKKAVKAYFSAAAGTSGLNPNAAPYGAEDDANDDGGDCGEGSDDECGDDGFQSCSDGGDEDGPAGGCGGPGCMPSAAGETLDDFGDDDDDEYDVYTKKDGGAPSSSSGAAATAGVTIRQDESSGQYEGRMYVSPLLYGFIIGKKGATLAETQRLTNTIIKVPKGNGKDGTSAAATKKASSSSLLPSDDDTIIIRGPDRASVTAALVKLEATVLENRSRVGYTHFLSIPLGKDKALKASAEAVLNKMKDATCNNNTAAADNNSTHRIDTSLFQDPSWLHFTVLMLRLHTHKELQLAKQLLHTEVAKAAEGIFGGGGNNVDNSRAIALQGLNMMNDDPSAVDVLYVEPKPADRLVELVKAINAIFIRNELCLRHDTARNDKLHATIMNSKFRKNNSGAEAAEQQRVPFDATKLLDQFKNAHFGDYSVHSIELSQMNPSEGGAGTAADGSSASRGRMNYYACEDSIEF